MTQRNTHGTWIMTFDNRMLHNEPTIALNEEGCYEWFEEMKDRVLSSSEGDTTPWVLLTDIREWEGASLEAWPVIDEITTWEKEHYCVFIAVVLKHELYRYTNEKHLNETNKSIIWLFGDYDEAYQACLDALTKAQNQQD